MPKEILLYSGIYDFVAESFITKMEAAKDDDITLRINTGGGDVQSGFGMIAKFAEHKGVKNIKVDGKANSMGAFFLAYADNVEALDVSEIVLHRAAYPSWVESREGFKDSEEFKGLVSINSSLRKGLESKIDIVAFEKETKVTLDSMFSTDSRIDVSLTPKQALKIGLINKVNKLTSKMSAEIQSNTYTIAAEFGVDLKNIKADILPVIKDKPKTITKMTIEDLKANHSEVYNQIFAKGSEAGIAERNDTVEAWLIFNDADAKTVSEGIKSGEKLSQAKMAELTRASFTKEELKKEEEATAEVVTPSETKKVELTAEKEQEIAALGELKTLFANEIN